MIWETKRGPKDFYARAREIRLKKLGPGHVDVATSYNKLGVVHSDMGNQEMAKDYYARALEIRLKKLGPDYVVVATSYSDLRIVHSNTDDK